MTIPRTLGVCVLIACHPVAPAAMWLLPRPAIAEPPPFEDLSRSAGAPGRSAADDALAARLRQHGAAARARLTPAFGAAGRAYPPRAVVLACFKAERQVELYAAGADGGPAFVRRYPILGVSGTIGPKLAEGDGQIPEGVYRIVHLNPSSTYHLSMQLDYPNAADRARARIDGRTRLGGYIMIHGGTASDGCLAMGDEAIEELFVLAADTGMHEVRAIVAPVDLRDGPLAPELFAVPEWVAELHGRLAAELARLPRPPGEVQDAFRACQDAYARSLRAVPGSGTEAFSRVAAARWRARLEDHWRRGERVSAGRASALAAAARVRAQAQGGFTLDRRIAEHEAGLWERDAQR